MTFSRVVLHRFGLGCLAAWMVLVFPYWSAMAQDQDQDPSAGKVYAMTNAASDNTVVVFARGADGSLTQLQEVSTGGLGSGPGVLPPPLPIAPGPDPLQSQDGLRLSDDGRFLLAVNAGSNEVSVFRVTPAGLELVEKTYSGGIFPVSIAIHRRIVYVLNEGENSSFILGGIGNVTGFLLDPSGHLRQIPNSTRNLAADSGAADVLFNPEGDRLMVTERFTNRMDMFTMREDGLTGEERIIQSNGPGPFAASFGQEHLIAVTESSTFLVNGRATGVTNGSTMSTYRLRQDGEVETISKSIPLNATASCWVRFTPDHHFAYTTNGGSGTISIVAVADDGTLTYKGAAIAGGPFSGVVDMDITPDGKFLYVLEPLGAVANIPPLGPLPPTAGRLQGFRIEADGSLTPLTTVGTFPFATQGLVVR